MTPRDRQTLRVLAYSHDSYGLGHLRRSLSVIGAMVRRNARVQALCVTGSPTPHVFDVPPRTELVKLPCITKDEDGDYRARSLAMPLHEIVDLRSDLITASVRSFRPHLVLVDHAATGAGDELLPVLRRLRHETLNAKVVLGMRDIIDAPHRVRAQMSSKGTVEVLRQAYDEVLVYGERTVLDVAEAYGLPRDVAERVRYVGFASRPLRGIKRRERDPASPPRILATAGGGGDGYRPLRGVIAAIRGPLRDRDLQATIVTGPLMPADDVAALRLASGHDPRIEVRVTADSMPERMADSDLLVGMGGYNTVYEALSLGCRFLALPRCHPRLEQLERCRRLEDLGLLHAVPEEDAADPNALAAALEAALDAPEAAEPRTHLRFDGAERAAEHLLTLLESHGHAAHPQPTHAGQR